MQLSRRHRAWLHSTFIVLFLSGAGWWILHRWFQVDTGFGAQLHPAQRWLLPLHGAVAMLVLILVGTLIPVHIKRGWQARRNRPQGVVFIAFIALLIGTGYALYYAGGESLRSGASSAHTAIGLALPAMLLWHIVSGRRTRRP